MFLEGEWVRDPKITAHLLKEKMDTSYAGMEEFQLNEQDIGRWLERVYERVRKERKGAGGGAGQEEEEGRMPPEFWVGYKQDDPAAAPAAPGAAGRVTRANAAGAPAAGEL
jgi:hypothetical protein